MTSRTTEDKRKRETEMVTQMIAIYCRGNHRAAGRRLCSDCRALTDYAAARVAHCPHMETKTFCSNCRTHCYKPDMRERIRRVMRYSGPRILFYHPITAIRHLIETIRGKRRKTWH